MPSRLWFLAFVPLASFLAELHYVWVQGRPLQILWVCHMANLFLAMLERMGAPAERFGDSTGVLGKLVA